MRKDGPAVIGVGRTSIGKHYNRSTLDLTSDSATASLNDAGMTWSDIDGLVVTEPLVGGFPRHALAVAENLGISRQLRHGSTITMGGASPLLGLVNASRAIEYGDCKNVLVIAADTPRTGQSRQASVRHFAEQRHPEWEQPIGMLNVSAYALLASEYLHHFGHALDSLLELPLMLRRHAESTPGAAYRDPITKQQALDSRLVSSPLRLIECSPINDGAAALVVSSARTSSRPAVKLAGSGFGTDYDSLAFKQSRDINAPARALKDASRARSLSVDQCDFAMLYDSYSIALAILLEATGISEPGQAAHDASTGRFDVDGDLPINPHGGLLSHGHCGGAAGMHHLVELVKQLRGEAENQVTINNGISLYQAEGGILSANTSAYFELA